MQSGQVTEDVVVSVTASAVHKELTDALEKLEDVSQEGDQYRAICPVHGGHGLTIRWNDKSNILVVHCHSSTCKQDDLVAELRKLGIHLGSARHRYEYRDENGVLRWTKVRSRAKDGRRFTYYMCHSHKGSVPIEGVHLGKKNKRPDGTCRLCGSSEHPRGMLYNREAVVSAIAASDEIWLVEGEKDADALTAKGVIATTAMNGVDDWGPIYVDQLAGARTVVIVADNDTHGAGKRGAYNRYLSLTEHVETVCVKVAKTGKDSYDHLQAGYGLKDFVDVPISELEALTQLSNGDTDIPADDPLPTERWTQYGYAKRFIELHGPEVVFDGHDWRYWDGVYWRRDERGIVLRMSARLSRRMSRVSDETLGPTNKPLHGEFANKQEGAGAIASTLVLAKSELSLPSEEFDTDTTLLVCRSGIYAGGGVFQPHDPLLLYTKAVPIEYDPTATCPEWEQFLRSSIPDRDQRRYLQTLIGFALVGGDRKKKRIVNLIGPKDTGKSTFLRYIGELLAPYMATPAVEELVSHKSRRQSDKFALSELRGARIAAASEIEAHSTFRVAPLKALTGGDVIQTQSKNRDPVEWRASIMCFIGTNERISFDVTDDAFAERQIDIVFRRKRKIDRTLDRKLDAEKAGIWNWILSGVDSYLRDELVEPQSVKDARVTAETELSIPFQFIRAGLESGMIVAVTDDFPVAKCCSVAQLYAHYEGWCKAEGVRNYPKAREFSRIMQRRYRKHDNASDGKNHFVGIAPKRATGK